MRPSEPAPCPSAAQPVVGTVSHPDDESNVTIVGTAPHAVYHDSLPSLH